MDHVAIDLGGRESQICVRSADGQILEETRWPTKDLKKYLGRRPPSRVIVETCAEAFAVADQAREAGHEAAVVPAMLVRALGVGERGLKNDQRDARHLSNASCRMERLPTVQIPSPLSREWKSMCGMREALVTARTKVVNNVRGWLRSQGLGTPRTGGITTVERRVREMLSRLKRPVPGYAERQLETVTYLSKQIVAANRELAKIAKGNTVARRLMSVPGVGPVTALRFIAAVDDIERFPDAHSLESYFGLTPGESSSSERKRTTSITKAGASRVRWVLVQAAWSAWRTRPNDPMVLWARDVAKRRGRPVAIVALARKLAGILRALWKKESLYNPFHRLASTAAATDSSASQTT
jgi:transposase